MNVINLIILIVATIFEADARAVECFYGNDYGCYLMTEIAAFSEKVTKIDGQHQAGYNDADVKFIQLNENNKLKNFSSIFCKKFPNLQEIHVDKSDLSSIQEYSFLDCKGLTALFLQINRIDALPENLLINNLYLTTFHVHNNHLTTLPENLFLNQKQLHDLFINNNMISSLPKHIFYSLLNLEVLYLNHNKLQSIDSNWFENLQNLRWLRLDGNQITEISSKCFESLTNLAKLFLDDNHIKDIDALGFFGLENLQQLNLDRNFISFLPPEVHTKLEGLTILSLKNNPCTTFNSKVGSDLDKCSRFDEKLKDNEKSKNNYNSCSKIITGRGTIIGGKTINHGDYPWIAALTKRNGDFFCGGTLITNRKVMTAAHCIQDKKIYKETLPRDIFVLLGMFDLKNHFEPGRRVNVIQSIKMHPDWNPFAESFDADIAVLVLDSEVAFSSSIQPICITYNSNIKEIAKGFVVGYGKSEDESKVHENIPKIIEMPIHDNVDCFLKNHLLATLSSRRTFCGGSGNGTGVCIGDSGSGFFVTDGSAYYLRGIVSSSLFNAQRSCDVGTYSVFTDISTYFDWINGIPTSRFK